MIKTQKIVPEYYYTESRDFQLIGRIFEAVFNYVKTASDLIINNSISSNPDASLMDLVTTTIGFESKHNYDVPSLVALANSFRSILMIKGTKKAIEDCVRVLLHAQNIYETFEVIVDTNTCLVTIYIPEALKDVSLLEDMLDYVLPAGFDYYTLAARVDVGGVGAEATSVDSIQYNQDSEGSQINYEDITLGTITRGVVTLSQDELTNIDKGVTDNTVVIKPELGD